MPPQRAYCLGMWGSNRDHHQCQVMTASSNAWVTRCLKQDPIRLYKDVTSSLPDATSSLKRRTSLVQPDVCNPLNKGRTATSVAAYHQHESLPKSVLNSLNSLVSRNQEQNDVTARLWSEKLNMWCTYCLLILTLWSAAAECNNRMPMWLCPRGISKMNNDWKFFLFSTWR